MTTIDYKEKYEQALERARQFSEKPYLEDSAGIVEYIFPELAESEDKRIRKDLLGYLHTLPNHFSHNGSLVTEWVAWLERQGKQNPDESKQETKPNGGIVYEDFNEGDGYYKVNLAYLSKEQVEEIETLVLKWNSTNEDIKNCIGMCLTDADEQRFKDYGTNLKECLDWLEEQAQKPSEYEDREYACQSSEHYTRRELMIYNLGIADGKRMIKETEQKPADEIGNYDHGKVLDSLMSAVIKTPEESLGIDSDTYNNIVDDCLFGEQKPAWSEEDKNYYDTIIAILENTKDDAQLSDNQMSFLKSLKDRVLPQSKQEWSEYDKMMFASIMNVPELDEQQKEWLATCNPQQKQEWSEDDERILNQIIKDYEKANESWLKGQGSLPFGNRIKWLKSIKDRIQPQNKWKPSEEQMEALDDFIYAKYPNVEKYGAAVKSLCQDLKKLREE